MTSAEASTSTAHIAFICAMPMELEPLRAKLDLRQSTVGGVTVEAGTLDGRRVVAIVTGMGTDLATAGTTRLLDAVTVERVVVVGITGAVVNGATGAEYRPAPLGDGTPAGTMWTTDTLITDQDEIAGLRSRGVVSLDMETAAIAELCERRAIPWSVFRVISDRASDGSIDEEVFQLSNMDGSPNNEAIERFFAEHPERLEAMSRLAEGALLATGVAADAAIRACTTG
jgi:nucleoside phosphorylase